MTMFDHPNLKYGKEILRRSGVKQDSLTELISQGDTETPEAKTPFTFSSYPKALNTNQKMSDRPHLLPYTNLMYEKRIFRGSNYSHSIQMTENDSAVARIEEARRRALARRKAQKKQITAAQLRLRSPPPVIGRKHEPVQTDTYLEEIWANPPLTDVTVQTDLYYERPVSPFYVAPIDRSDSETQIYPGELFNFDEEVQPILQVLVGKTIEQSLIEVLEEEELFALKVQKRRFVEEKCETLAVADDDMKDAISDLLPSILDKLKDEVLFTQVKIDDEFMNWLTGEVVLKVQEMACSEATLSDIVRNILEDQAKLGAFDDASC